MNKTFLYLLHAAAAAGLSSTELVRGVGGGGWAASLCSKWPAVEDLMALSVQSLVGSLAGYRCLL